MGGGAVNLMPKILQINTCHKIYHMFCYCSVVEFHPDISKLQLFTAGSEDHAIRIWDLQTSSVLAELSSHFSVVTAIQFSQDVEMLYSAGRDQVITVWDLESRQKEKTIPVYEVRNKVHVKRT